MKLKKLQSQLQGELHWDSKHRAAYATDASLYQISPHAVAIPKNVDDLKSILSYCRDNHIPITARGSATSLAGQTVGQGMIIDFNKHFNKIIEINYDDKYAIIEPGVYRDSLNIETSKYNLHFAPDPATSSRATFGGMIANNSSGTRSILYGKTIDHIISLQCLMPSGEIIEFSEKEIDNLDDDAQSELLEKLRPFIFENSEEIQDRYPKVMRRVSGYALDEFCHTNKWNLSKLICGSEGTLALILSAKVKLTPLPKLTSLNVLHFDDRHAAINMVETICHTGPASVELLDENVLHASSKNRITKEYYDTIVEGEPKALLFVEYFGETHSQLETKSRILHAICKSDKSFFHCNYYTDPKPISYALSLRKKGLGILMNHKGVKKPLPFIEDSCIPLEYLSEYVDKIEDYCNELNTSVVLYAHASVGVLHIRPYLNINHTEDLEKLEKISNYAFSLVKQYGGSWSGEHGDGRIRSYHLKEFYGEKIYDCWKSIKNIFDPLGLLNPNIIVDANPILDSLRTHPETVENDIESLFYYRGQGSFQSIVSDCSGVGACVKHNVGTMCPSYMATNNEIDATRGRANILRMAIRGELKNSSVVTPEVTEALNLCLSCKACKNECPSNVDMAKLKSEYLQLEMSENGSRGLQKFLYNHSHQMSKLLSGRWAPVVNFIKNTTLTRYLTELLAGISRNRKLPDYSSYTLTSWYKKNYYSKNIKKVALFCDTYINYHEPHIGRAAIKLLDDAGYYVALAQVGCCQRPRISNGFLHKAKESGQQTLLNLKKYFDQNIPLVVCEPSCTSALIDDLPDLMENDYFSQACKKSVFAIDQFVLNELNAGRINKNLVYMVDDILYHKHCHAQALWNDDIIEKLPSKTYDCPDSGCCGMAGGFGYEKDKYAVSKKVFDQRLAKTLKEKDSNTSVVASGFSCRHQIKDFSDWKAKHWVEVVKWE